MPGHPLHDLDGQIAVGDADVDLQPADQLLVDEQPVLLLHPAVASGRGQLEVGEHRAGCGARGGDPEALGSGDLTPEDVQEVLLQAAVYCGVPAANAAFAAADRILTELTHDREGSYDDDEHDPDGVTLSSEWSRLTGLAEAAASELQEVDDALARIEAGTYGTCTSCGKKIPVERLEAVPWTKLCIDDARRLAR